MEALILSSYFDPIFLPKLAQLGDPLFLFVNICVETNMLRAFWSWLHIANFIPEETFPDKSFDVPMFDGTGSRVSDPGQHYFGYCTG